MPPLVSAALMFAGCFLGAAVVTWWRRPRREPPRAGGRWGDMAGMWSRLDAAQRELAAARSDAKAEAAVYAAVYAHAATLEAKLASGAYEPGGLTVRQVADRARADARGPHVGGL